MIMPYYIMAVNIATNILIELLYAQYSFITTVTVTARCTCTYINCPFFHTIAISILSVQYDKGMVYPPTTIILLLVRRTATRL